MGITAPLMKNKRRYIKMTKREKLKELYPKYIEISNNNLRQIYDIAGLTKKDLSDSIRANEIILEHFNKIVDELPIKDVNCLLRIYTKMIQINES